MTALANSLRRIRSAKNRSPRLTGRGQSGSIRAVAPQQTVGPQESDPILWVRDKFLELAEITQRTAPAVIVIALRILR
jgi:hypothetical protein